MVGADYLEAMGIPLLAARAIGREDVRTAPAIVLVNRTLAEKLFPGANPIGRRVLLGWEGGKNPNWRTIVGLYGDVRHGGLDTDKNPQRMELAVPSRSCPSTWASSDSGEEPNRSTNPGPRASPDRQLDRTVAPAVRGAHDDEPDRSHRRREIVTAITSLGQFARTDRGSGRASRTSRGVT